MVVFVQITPPDYDRMFGALADRTRRDIVRRAILERAGLVTKMRIGRRKVVRTNLEGLRVARRLLDKYEDLWRGRVDRMTALVSDMKEDRR